MYDKDNIIRYLPATCTVKSRSTLAQLLGNGASSIVESYAGEMCFFNSLSCKNKHVSPINDIYMSDVLTEMDADDTTVAASKF